MYLQENNPTTLLKIRSKYEKRDDEGINSNFQIELSTKILIYLEISIFRSQKLKINRLEFFGL